MAFFPSINNSFAGVTFGPTWGYGDVPVTMQFALDDLPSPNTQVYQTGCLLAQGSDAAHLVLYNKDNQAAHPFKGVFFDELAPAADSDGAIPGFVNVAINSRPSTLFLYSILLGASGGTVDIDYLITNGFADIVYQYENGVQIKLVQFKGMGTGA